MTDPKPEILVTDEQIEEAHQRYLKEEAAAKHVTGYAVSVKDGCLHVALMCGIDCIGIAEFDPVSKYVTITRYVTTDWPGRTGLRHKIDYKEPDGESVIEVMLLLSVCPSNNLRLDNIRQEYEAITEIVDGMMKGKPDV